MAELHFSNVVFSAAPLRIRGPRLLKSSHVHNCSIKTQKITKYSTSYKEELQEISYLLCTEETTEAQSAVHGCSGQEGVHHIRGV